MIFEELKEFNKDLKKLLKKYPSLNEDIEIVKKVLSIEPDERPPFSFRINRLALESPVIKVKKISCKSLKGKGVKSGFRLIYAYFKQENRIVFIELYHKSDKDNEDMNRILRYVK